MMKMPKIIYANRVNLGGMWGKKPVRMKWDEDTESWWDSTGDFDARQLGLEDSGGCITFASESKEEVEAWTQGALSVMKMVHNWSG
jgi:hypothetical protein